MDERPKTWYNIPNRNIILEGVIKIREVQTKNIENHDISGTLRGFNNLHIPLNNSNGMNSKGFQEVEQENKWARENLSIKSVDYTGFDIKVANKVNKEFARLQKRYPQVVREIDYIRTIKGQKEFLVNKGLWDIVIAYAGSIKAQNEIENAFREEDTIAARYFFINGYTGIGFNSTIVSSHKKFADSAQGAKKSGLLVIQTGEEVECVLRHEFGHAIHMLLKQKGMDRFIIKAWGEFLTEIEYHKYRYFLNDPNLQSPHYIKAHELLSKYGATNIDDFFAEAFSEYEGSPNPRRYARQIGEEIEKIFNIRK